MGILATIRATIGEHWKTKSPTAEGLRALAGKPAAPGAATWKEAAQSVAGPFKSTFKVLVMGPIEAVRRVFDAAGRSLKVAGRESPWITATVLVATVVTGAVALVGTWLGYKAAKGTVNVISSGAQSVRDKVAARAAASQEAAQNMSPEFYANQGKFTQNLAAQPQTGVAAGRTA